MDYEALLLTNLEIAQILASFKAIAPYQLAKALHGVADAMKGAGDPRLKDSLERSGVKCWVEIEPEEWARMNRMS